MSSLVVSLTIVTEHDGEAARAAEALGRAATGLALEGISVSLSIGTIEDDDEEPT